MRCCMANFEFHIAWRYLFSKKGHNAINIVSGISAAAVAVVTAAMVCVLSVMNGFGRLVEHMFSEFDPVLLVVPAEGQTLRTDTIPVVSLFEHEDISALSMQLEQTALIRYKDHQMPARVMGVDDMFTRTAHIDSIITDGYYSVWDGAFERAVLGRGLAAQIGMNAHFTGALHLYAPERTGHLNLMRPDLSLRHEHAFIAGTFAVNQIEYDDQLMLVSLPLAQRLFDYDAYTATALRIQPEDNTRSGVSKLKSELSAALGTGYKVLDRYEQQEDFFRILRIEKLLTILLLVFILLIASFNIIGSLSMLIIDKREDIRILSHLGADEQTIRRVFLLEGWFISALGTFIGLITGVVLCLGQQHFGWLKLGSGSEYIISAYPVLVQAADIILVAAIVLVLGFVAAWYPSRKMKSAALVVLIALCTVSCKRSESVESNAVWPSEYTTAYEERYGQCYDSVPYQVVALDIYSGDLKLDSTHRMKGTGYNLYISDIFVEDTLIAGTYTSGTEALPFTFLPGHDYEGTPTGIYLLYVEKDKLKSIQVLQSGTMTVSEAGNGLKELQCTFHYTNSNNVDATYECHYRGALIPWLKK